MKRTLLRPGTKKEAKDRRASHVVRDGIADPENWYWHIEVIAFEVQFAIGHAFHPEKVSSVTGLSCKGSVENKTTFENKLWCTVLQKFNS